MSDAYDQLLDGVVQHLAELKERGIQFVAVSPETLAGLSQRPPASLATRFAAKAADKVALASTPASGPGVSPSKVRASGGGTPPKLAGEDARATIKRAPTAPMPEPPAMVEQALSLGLPGETVTPAAPPPPLSQEAKTAAFAELRERAMACAKCPHLATARQNVVFGVGDVSAQLMFIGEAPGADEDEQGEPFVGRAGELLTKIIKAMGLSRGAVYIGNILKCRPDTPGQASGNRKPTPEEMQTCIAYLHEQIDLIRPKVIVALGGTAVEGLLGKTIGITRLRGQWRIYRGIPLMPTYHPAYLLRNQAPSEKRRVWEDMLQVMERLGLPISAKQRSYFQ